jgi:hypothetical protein
MTLQEFKDITRDQAMMMRLDSAAVLQTMPKLLEGSSPAAIREALESMKHVLEAAEPLNPAARASLAEMERIFETAARAATAKREPSAPTRPAARKPAAAKRDAAPAESATPAARPRRAATAASAKSTPQAAVKAAARKQAAPVRVRKPATAKAKPE